MKNIIIIVLILFCSAGAQTLEKQNGSEPGEFLGKNFLFCDIKILKNDGSYFSGSLFGVNEDSVIIIFNNKSRISFDFKDIYSLKLEYASFDNTLAIQGMLLGTYVGQLLLFTGSENQFFRSNEKEGLLWYLLNLFPTAALGGLGYYFSSTGTTFTEAFRFSDKSISDYENEVKRFKHLIIGKSDLNRINLYFQMAQVFSRFSRWQEKEQNLYSYDNISSFNLLRKIQLTYSLSHDIEAGAAIMWIGEPRIYDFPYHYNGYFLEELNKSMGYYLVMQWDPFQQYLPDNVKLSLGTGVGIAAINYSSKLTNYNPSENLNEEEITKRYSTFSSDVFVSLGLILSKVSFSLIADYVYIPEKTASIPYLGLNAQRMGNFSVGLSLGFIF